LSTVPGFDIEKAREYVLNYEPLEIRDFAKLLFYRDIEGVSIKDSSFLRHQNELLPHLDYGLNTWIKKNQKRTFISFQEVMAFFGYLGLNGTEIPKLVKAIDHTFAQYPRRDGAFIATSGKINKCANTAFLRAALALGFAEDERVKQACAEYLTQNLDQMGACHVRTDNKPCGYVMVKSLRWLNEYPKNWRNKEYHMAVKNIRDYLLGFNLSAADYPRRRPEPNPNWFKFGYFRSYQSSIFEAAEALALSGVKSHPQFQKALEVIGSTLLDNVTWKPQYVKTHWPVLLEIKQRGKFQGSPWLTLRGLRIANALKH
jgi:hypothetical protein